jgi:predicted outer membrane protein
MRRRILFLAALAPLGLSATRGARAQIRIRPDSSPRLPQQPGQGLPIEDRRFIRDAMALSAAQLRAASQAASAGGEQETSRLAAALAERHRRLLDELHSLATARGLQPDAPIPEAEAPSGPQVAAAIRRLHAASDPRAFLAAEVELHPVLVELYQTEASNSLDHQLSQFAIVSLVGIQEDFAAVVRLAERQGLPRPEGMLSNPPQYGPGAGPRR